MDETIRTHTDERTKVEFAKDVRDQDPDFGVTPLSLVLQRTSNAARYISKFLSFDEEIAEQLGRIVGMSFCPDKRKRRGRKIFALCGSNHVDIDTEAPKGYYFM